MSEFLFTVEKFIVDIKLNFCEVNSDVKKTINVNSNQGPKMAYPRNSTRPTQFVIFCMGFFLFFFLFFFFFFETFFSKLSWPGGIPWVGHFWGLCQMRNFTYSNWSLTHFFLKSKL